VPPRLARRARRHLPLEGLPRRRCHAPQDVTLEAGELMRRFLLHVLPSGFHRVHHYGLLANASRKANIAQARQLLQSATDVPADAQDAARPPTERDQAAESTSRRIGRAANRLAHHRGLLPHVAPGIEPRGLALSKRPLRSAPSAASPCPWLRRCTPASQRSIRHTVVACRTQAAAGLAARPPRPVRRPPFRPVPFRGHLGASQASDTLNNCGRSGTSGTGWAGSADQCSSTRAPRRCLTVATKVSRITFREVRPPCRRQAWERHQ
jgi:hypothetical protein